MRTVTRAAAFLFGLLAWCAAAIAADLPPPGVSGNLAGNSGGVWAPFTVGTGLSVTGSPPTLANTGVSSYPAAGIPQSTGSAWGTSITPGTGVVTALGTNVGSAGAFVVNGGALGTPSSGNGANLTGLVYTALPGLSANQVLGALTATTPSGLTVPSCSTAASAISWTSGTGFGCNTSITAAAVPVGGITGLGTGVAAALAVNVGSSGAFVTFGGALGTPSSGNGSNLTGLVYTALPTLSANQLLGALTATTPSGQSVPSCSATGNGLNWTSGTGFGCPTFLTSTTGVTTWSGGSTGLTPSGATSGAVTLAGTLVAGNGGTGQTSVAAAFTSFFESVATTLGDVVYGGASGAPTRLAGNAATQPSFYTSTGTGSAAQAVTLTTSTGTAGSAVVLATSPTLVTPALGTPTALVATNATGTATGLTSGITQALASATTTVNVSSATAPTIAKVLTATSGTAATWQTPTGGEGPGLALFYNALSTVNSQVVRIFVGGDSILHCGQQAPCNFGPSRISSTFPYLLINELANRFPIYSTGYRAIERLANASVVPSAGDGVTLTSGTATNSTTLGPQESGMSANGGSLFTISSGGVLTFNVGQPYSSVNFACVQGTGISGYTVTINGSSVGTACGSGSGTATATIQNFVNPVAFASQPATGSTLTLTALGAVNDVYAYEAVLFCGASNTACTAGLAIDGLGVGASSSPWFASGTASGATDGGMVWVKAFSGQLGLCIIENGPNDSNSTITTTQQQAQNQIIATDCQTKNASVLWMGPPPWSGIVAYSNYQQGMLAYCRAQGWACMNLSNLFMGNISGTTSSTFPFVSQNAGAGLVPPWNVAQGLSVDGLHFNDCGELLATQYFMNTVFSIWPSYTLTSACSQNPQTSGISSNYTNATTGFTIVSGTATANTGQLEFVSPANQIFKSTCAGNMTVGTTGIVSVELVGSAAISNINLTFRYQTAANSAYSFVSATALASAMATSSITAAAGLEWELVISGVNGASPNSYAVEMHEASGTLTVTAGATCSTQLSGPQ